MKLAGKLRRIHGHVLLALLGAVGIAGGILVLSAFLGPRRPNPVKMATYECGIPLLVPFGCASR